MMRPMVLEYPDDPACRYLDRQYMLGASLLVAPVFNEEGTAEYYLPHGTWTNFWTGALVEGGRWYTETVGFMQIPLFARENTLLPMGAVEDRCDYDYLSDLTLHLFGLTDGGTAAAQIPGSRTVTITARREGHQVTVTSDSPLTNARVQIGRNGSVFDWADTSEPLKLEWPEATTEK